MKCRSSCKTLRIYIKKEDQLWSSLIFSK
ncbi:hypothetical protein LKM13_18355 [Bacillus anthracis]|nr:hypothetical protein [Bacillus anthracis]USL05043.1 hypothetical protein LIS83_06080 [Bacillus anthracis]